MTKKDIASRSFQLWEYRVSHSSLLIRSPRVQGLKTNIDIIFMGVEYMALPRYLPGVEIVEALPDELIRLGEILGERMSKKFVRVLVSSGNRYPVVAAFEKIDENENDIFDSPFT